MTSYSTYGTGRLQLVDGALHHGKDLREEQIGQLAFCVTAGAARALLDCTIDIRDPEGTGPEIAAEQWHSAAEGWELAAIVDADQFAFVDTVRDFVEEFTQEILTLGKRIAWDERYQGETWHGNDGMGYYRVGMLLGYTGAGTGIGFSDYDDPRYGSDVSDRMSAWARERNLIGWEQSWIDSDEEPNLLHLSA